MVTGVRGLCNGLGPAVYGVIFYIFNVKVDEGVMDLTGATEAVEGEEPAPQLDPAPELDPPLVDSSILPGPPFLFGACSVVLGTCYTSSNADQLWGCTIRPLNASIPGVNVIAGYALEFHIWFKVFNHIRRLYFHIVLYKMLL